MSAAIANHPQEASAARPVKLDDVLPMFGGGFALAGVAILVGALIDALAIALVESFGADDALGWSTGVVIGLCVFAVIVSVLLGRWLLNLRRWIGTKADPADSELVRRKRRSFMIGAMTLYVPVTPLLWVMVLAITSSAT